MNYYTADQIRNMMLTDAFYQWYQTKFDAYVLDESGASSRDEINQDIEQLMETM